MGSSGEADAKERDQRERESSDARHARVAREGEGEAGAYGRQKVRKAHGVEDEEPSPSGPPTDHGEREDSGDEIAPRCVADERHRGQENPRLPRALETAEWATPETHP
jgi:hypothetical protein